MTAFNSQVGQLYYGTGGPNTGAYTNKATFLSDHPGLTLETFAGIAPANGTAAWSNTAAITMTISDNLGGTPTLLVYDRNYWVLSQTPFAAAPFESVGPDAATDASSQTVHTINFTTPVTAAGFNLASLANGADILPRTVQFYDGVTLLHTETYTAVPPVPSVDVFTAFIGYSTGSGPPAAAAYEQESNTDDYEQESNTDLYIQE